MSKIAVPSAYSEGYIKARQYDQVLADNYARHITMGDAELDPIMRELASLPVENCIVSLGLA